MTVESEAARTADPPPSASYSFMKPIQMSQPPGAFGEVAPAMGAAGAVLGAMALARVERTMVVRDVTVTWPVKTDSTRQL